MKNYKDFRAYCGILIKRVIKVKYHGENRGFLLALKCNPTTPIMKLMTLRFSNLNYSHVKSGDKGKGPALIFKTPIGDNQHSLISQRM